MKKKKSQIIFFILLLLVTVTLFVFKKSLFLEMSLNSNSSYTNITPSNKESCLQCHTNTKGYSEHHNPEVIGCSSCHLGNTLTQDKEKAHQGMVLIPGNLSDAPQTCGKCHADELSKINTSLMTTNSGIVAVDKFIFGEADSPDYHYHIKDLKNTAGDKHLRDLCANCHLGAEKKEFGKINELSRGGGCNACHLNYSEQAITDLENYHNSEKKILPQVHPSTDIFVNDTHCFGCHSRSSRISTNYEGWHETLLEKDEVIGNNSFRILEDDRVYSKRHEDVHHTKGMLCIDCHSSHEVMGNGKTYTHEEQVVTLQCSDCHYKEKPNTINYNELDKESLLVFMHRQYTHKDTPILIVNKDKHPLVNTYLDTDNKLYLIGKKDGIKHEIVPQSNVCAKDNVHNNVSCATCHSSWTPRCIGCHTDYEKNKIDGYDLLDKKQVTGQWIEHVAEFSTSLPAMGVRENKNGKQIEPAIPGMIMTIDKGSFNGQTADTSFHRLYAPNSPHTTTKEVRDCKSCHTNPVALGYGMGKLTYSIKNGKGTWLFTPDYEANPHDNLPEDAWVGFLNEKNQNKTNSTRTDFRPFSVKEQKEILLVGACLQCHKEDSEIMQESLVHGIQPLLKKLDKQCVLPSW